MKKLKYLLTLILGVVLLACLTACNLVLTLPDDDKPVPDPPLTYTVTVTCTEEEALADIKVQLFVGETAATEPTALTDGKVSFSLSPKTYTVKLIGMPEGYTYESASVTVENPAVTVALTPPSEPTPPTPPEPETIEYSVAVTCDNQAVFTDLAVELHAEDGTLAAGPLRITGSRAAIFELAPATYTVSLSGIALKDFTYPETVLTADSPAATIVLTQRPSTGDGSEDSPYLLEKLTGDYEAAPQKVTTQQWGETVTDYLPVYYSYTETKNSTYTVTTDIGYLNLFLEDEEGESVFSWYESRAGKYETFSLEAGKTYLLYAGVDEANSDSFEDGDKLTWSVYEGNARWAGEGTEEAPYVIRTLTGSYTVEIPAASDPASPMPESVFFTYTAAEGGDYTLTAAEDGLMLLITDEEGESVLEVTDSSAGEAEAFSLEAGTYLFYVGETSGMGATVTFTIAEDAGDVQQGTGTEEDPYILQNIIGTHTVAVPVLPAFGMADDVYYSYLAPTDGTYTVTAGSADLLLYIDTESGTTVLEWSSGHESSAVISLKAGTRYLLRVTSDRSGLEGDSTEVSFTVAESTEADGSEEAPYLLEELAGNYTADTSRGQVYYRYTADETATYTLTTTVDYLTFYIEGVVNFDSSEAKSKVFRLEEGVTYVIVVGDLEDNLREVPFTIAKGGEITTVTYSVTIAGVDSSRVTGLKVTLVAEDGTKTEPKSPIIGSTVQFTIAAGTYTVEITGDLMAEYTFTSPTLTADSPRATVTLVPREDAGTPDSRWKGVGTVASPYLLTSLEGDVTVAAKGTTSYYFQYTAAEDGTYLLTSEYENLYLSLDIQPWVEGSTRIAWYGGEGLKLHSEFKVFAGCVYTFIIKDNTGAGGEVGFTLAKKDLSQKVLSVTLGNDIPAFMGKVTVPSELFAQGDEATVTITAKTGYKVAAVKVNGKLTELTGPQLKIKMEDNTTVSVYYTAEARTTADGKQYFPALVGTWHNGTRGDLVVGADGTVTLGGKAATIMAAKSEGTPNQHDFFFDVTVGTQTTHLYYNLETNMFLAGQGSDSSNCFFPVVDLAGFTGTYTGERGTLAVAQNSVTLDGEKLEVVAAYNADAGAADIYVYLPAEKGSSRYVAYLLTVEGGTLTLTLQGAAETFTKA